ncbi:hypothetical protein INQ25_01400 [Wolbachia endosymbiont of Rhagoletis cerasi]|nr:hypothetical protein [Wolbachia endosymbiont of Rhagoletis cerasi]MBS9530065.1 hypothetical protein [Wolbachia endosymbiont of Rhagoletis cerasi]
MKSFQKSIANPSNTSYRDSFHNCTNIVILAHQIPVLDTGMALLHR